MGGLEVVRCIAPLFAPDISQFSTPKKRFIFGEFPPDPPPGGGTSTGGPSPPPTCGRGGRGGGCKDRKRKILRLVIFFAFYLYSAICLMADSWGGWWSTGTHYMYFGHPGFLAAIQFTEYNSNSDSIFQTPPTPPLQSRPKAPPPPL